MLLSTRLLILGVFCTSYRLVSTTDDVVPAENTNGGGSNTDSPTTTEEITTTEVATSTVELSTTEGIDSTSSPGNLSCVLDNKVCVLEGTTVLCDPCEGVVCDADKSCLGDKSKCTTECLCTDETKVIGKDGLCVNPCDPSPCKNKQNCVLDLNLSTKLYCNCSSDYEGQFCETVHNYCTDAHPAHCPSGAYECIFKGVGKYDCTCAGGHVLNKDTNSCTKVTQEMAVTLSFDTYYMEVYNIEGNPNRTLALNSITGAMRDLYGDLLISIKFENFTQGSLVAHYTMEMRMPPNGDSTQNEYDLMKYVTNCATNNGDHKTCFDDLGKPFLPQDGIKSEDLRCKDVFCPVGTECETVDKSETSVRCTCQSGYSLDKTVVEDTGRQVDICTDIDECTVSPPCKDGELCVNTPGSFECYGSPCDKNPCPGNAVCKAVDHYAYNCECEWIYIASDCGTPWPLILVIVSSVLLALLILAIIGLIILFSRSKKGSSVIDSTSF